MRRPLVASACFVALAGLAACGEKPQVAGSSVKGQPAYVGTGVGPYTDSGWKAGEAKSWEEQMRTRTQSGQNEYVRSGGV
ncbi:MAG: hypothetical protein U5L05_06045 [Rubrivivax sp.]|nr:hypothetical protein [Rubrivivax sp.]